VCHASDSLLPAPLDYRALCSASGDCWCCAVKVVKKIVCVNAFTQSESWSSRAGRKDKAWCEGREDMEDLAGEV
jgi:ferredoxin